MNRVASSKNDNVRKVLLKTLDKILNGRVPAIIKIDVEGFEAELLKDGVNTLMQPGLRALRLWTSGASLPDRSCQ